MCVFDIVNGFITNYDAVLDCSVSIDNEKLDILREYCGVIDEILAYYGGRCVNVSIDKETNFVVLSINVDAFSANRFNQSYFDIIERSISVTVFSVDNGMVGIRFEFPSVFCDN